LDAPSKTPLKLCDAQDISGIGCRFFWILFFGQAKKSITPAGAGTGIKRIRRRSRNSSKKI